MDTYIQNIEAIDRAFNALQARDAQRRIRHHGKMAELLDARGNTAGAATERRRARIGRLRLAKYARLALGI